MAGSMKRILYLTDQGLTAFVVEGRRLVGKRHYGQDQKELDAFEEDLRQAPEMVTRLVLDVTEEEFHEEKVPHVFSHDQKKILERRRRQRFRGGRWSFHQRQGREKQGRKDDIFLLSGITREEVVQPWLDRLTNQCVPLDSMVSVPLLAPRLYRMMRLKQENVLFVSHGEGGGIRQTFLHRGRLKASRLAPTPRYEEKEYAGHMLAEVRRMKQFLNSAYLLPFGESLHIYVLGSNEINSLMGREVADEDGIRLHNYNLTALETRFHFQGFGSDDHADAFFSLLAATQKGIPSYATPVDKRCFYHHRARQSLAAAAAVIMVAGVAAIANELFLLLEQQEDLLQVEQEIALYQAKHERLRQTRPPGEISGFLMRDAVEFHRQLEKLAVSPFDYFPGVGQSLLRHPSIRLRRLNYRLVGDAGDLEENSRLPEPRNRLSALDRMAEQNGEASRRPLPVLELEGEIQAGDRSYRQVHQDFTNWLAGMKATGEFSRIHVKRWPLEIRSERSLVMDSSPAQGSRPFRFALMLEGKELL